jgi:hypothetical protein
LRVVLERRAAEPDQAVEPDRPAQPDVADRPDRSALARRPLYAASRLHLSAMSDDVGLWQHSLGVEPDPRFGYCTDDVARSIVVDLLQSREMGLAAVDASIRRSLRFVGDAFDDTSGRFLNFRTADGSWLETGASEDCHARALAGLAAVVSEMPGTEVAERARQLFTRALPAANCFGALRAISATLLACDVAIDAELSTAAEPAFELLAARLAKAFGLPGNESRSRTRRPEASRPAGLSLLGRGKAGRGAPVEWPWPEPVLTYENPLVPQALIAAGLRLGRPSLIARGCSVLDWLIDVQAGESGQFSPVGTSHWWHRTAERSQFDQQPIEGATMVSAAAAAYRATGRVRYLDAAETAYGWFLGDNDLGVALADPARGACCDGLTPTGRNTNQGAESTLMWLAALEKMRELRRSTQGGSGTSALAELTSDPGGRR